MLSVNEAKKIILEFQKVGDPVVTGLAGAVGQILAKQVYSQTNLPIFDSSAMDGYALRSEETQTATTVCPVSFAIAEEIWAGKNPEREVQSGECARIMTGAKMPHGANAVVIKEKVTVQNDHLIVSSPVTIFENVRHSGEEIKIGEVLFPVGTHLNPAAIGALAGAGVTEVWVYPKPRVAVISTGSELVTPGTILSGAQIYESNSFALRAALEVIGCEVNVLPPVKDDPAALKNLIIDALSKSTHVVMSGGVSVGDYDFNRQVLAELQVEEVFWKVAQKPGKPLFFDRHGETLVFGLPGNPASALTCFYEYVRPALQKYSGDIDTRKTKEFHSHRRDIRAKLKCEMIKPAGMTHFIRGRLSLMDGILNVEPLKKQQSHMMVSLALSDCLIVLPQEGELFPVGTEVEVKFWQGWR